MRAPRPATRAPLRTLLLPLAPLLLAGCTLAEPAPGVDPQQPCGPVHRTAAPFGEEGPLLRILVLKETPRPATLCVRVNDNNAFVHGSPDARGGPQATPDVRTVAEGRFTERELRVVAWVAGGTARASETFALTEENHVVVTFAERDGRLALDLSKHDREPLFM